MFEVLHHYMPQINISNALERFKLKEREYFLVSAHREENVESDLNFAKLIKIFNGLAEDYSFPVIISTHPRMQAKFNTMNVSFHPLVNTIKPLNFCDYVSLELHSKAVLSDSGTISEESSILNFPALNLREAHERPEGMEEACVMMTGLEYERVKQALVILESQSRGPKRNVSLVEDYNRTGVSYKVLKIIQSYTDYINRKVWKKF